MPKKAHKHAHAHKQKKHPQTSKMNILKGNGKYSRPRAVKGRGGYAEDVGGQIGGWLGKKAGGFLSSIFGLGEYKVNKNSLISGTAAPSDPPIVSNTSAGTRIQHREYIKDIRGSVDFAIETFPVQPGLATTFPWLSSVSGAFEEYILHGILFEFKSTSADALNSTNTALGTVIMATEYNPLHGPFTGKRDMENYVYSTSSPPSVSAIHPIECARDVTVLSELFVRNVPLTGADLRFSDLGLFQIATVGMQAVATIGELWVTYDIELLKPKLPDAYSSVGPAHYAYALSTSNPNPNNGAPIVTNLFGTRASQKFQLLGTGVSPVYLESSNIHFTATGRYMIYFNNYSANAWTSTIPLITTAGDISFLPIIRSGGVAQGTSYAPQNGVGVQASQVSIAVDVKNVQGDPFIVLNLNYTITANPEMDLWIMPLPTGFSTPILSEIDQLRLEMNLLKSSVLHIVEEHEDELDYKEAPQEAVFLRHSAKGHPLSESTTSLANALLDRLSVRSA